MFQILEVLTKKRVLMSRSAAFLWSERFCIASACSSDPCGNNAFRKLIQEADFATHARKSFTVFFGFENVDRASMLS